MIHIELQNTLGLQPKLRLHRREVLLHLEGHALAAGEAHRMGLQLGGRLHRVHAVAQDLLDEAKGLLIMLGLVRLLLVPQLQIAVNGGAEGLVLIGVQDIGQELVRLIREVQDLHAVILQQLCLGHMVDGLHRVAGGEIDVLLPLLHPAHILRQRHQLLLRGGVEQQQIL